MGTVLDQVVTFICDHLMEFRSFLGVINAYSINRLHEQDDCIVKPSSIWSYDQNMGKRLKHLYLQRLAF